MPILSVQLIGAPPAAVLRGLPQRVADAAGEVFRTPPQTTWVTVSVVPRSRYAENGGGPPRGAKPVLVRVVKGVWPSRAAMEGEVEALTKAIARAVRRPPAGVHVVYEPEAAGRIAFGGRLVPRRA